MFTVFNALSLQGMSLEQIKIIESAGKAFEAAQQGQFDGLEEKWGPMYQEMGKDIARQRKRLGGDWAIAQAVFTRAQRDALRKIIGPDLVFIVLQMTKDCQTKRLQARHGTGDEGNAEEFVKLLNAFHDLYEPAGYDEENAYNVMITEDMSIDDVMKKVWDIVEDIEKKSSKESKMPWKNGVWYSKGYSRNLLINVDNEKVDMKPMISVDFPEGTKKTLEGTWSYGEFGEATPEIVEASGFKKYNLEMDYQLLKKHGVLDVTGSKVYLVGSMSRKMEVLSCLNEEEFEKIKDERDPADAPSISYYKPQPDKPGKLVWLSGKLFPCRNITYNDMKQIKTNKIYFRPTWSWKINISSINGQKSWLYLL